MILDAFLSRDFPEIGLTKILQSIVEVNFQAFCYNKFPLSKCLETIKLMWYGIKTALENLAEGVSQGKYGFKDEWAVSKRGQFTLEIEQFVKTVDEHVKSFEDLLEDLEDDSRLAHDMMAYCVQFVQAEHEAGRIWACKFFEYTSMNTANLILKRYQIVDDQEDSLKTHIETLDDEDEERYIQITFSPQRFLIRDFEKLSLQFFHEYASHLSADVYQPLQGQGEQPPEDVLTSFRKIPTELDEGWMMHTAPTFIRDKGHELMSRGHQHMRENIEGSIDEWIRQLMHPRMADRVTRAFRGGRLAFDFLSFLHDKVCNGDGQRAISLYYRFSFDLIIRYSHSAFHLRFMDTLDYWMSNLRDELANVMQECLNIQGGFIDLDLLWTRIQQKQPRL